MSGLTPTWLPFRFARIPGVVDQVLVTSETGEYLFLNSVDFQALAAGALTAAHPRYEDLLARHILAEGAPYTELIAAQYRTRKAYLRQGPGLHLFVVTLRCDHACRYCQVSRRGPGASPSRYDLSSEDAAAAIETLFSTPNRDLTIEFQGGEPLLAFPRIREIVERVLARNADGSRRLRFVVTSTLHALDESMLDFFAVHDVHLSTSLDGPEWLHNANRPNRDQDSFRRTLDGIALARSRLGHDAVAALTTLTRQSLDYPEAIIDTYVEQGFNSIFLRPLSPYGFAAREARTIGYDSAQFLAFYEKALDYLIRLNLAGVAIEETLARMLLNNILTPFPLGYVDLRSPAGAGFGALVYNYDGGVYASDESRMLAEMGDRRLRLGSAGEPYRQLLASEGMQWLLAAGVAEGLPGCEDCAFLPYCGADPIESLARCGDPISHRPSSPFCRRQTGLFELFFRHLYAAKPDVLRVFLAWLRQQPIGEIPCAGYNG